MPRSIDSSPGRVGSGVVKMLRLSQCWVRGGGGDRSASATSSRARVLGGRNPKSGSAAVDRVVFVIVIVALGFLAYPCIRLMLVWLTGVVGFFLAVLVAEICYAPAIYGLVGMNVCCAGLGCWLLMASWGRKRTNPKCKRLKKAAEYEFQLETEEYMRKLESQSTVGQCFGMFRKGVFELPWEQHHQELEEDAPDKSEKACFFGEEDDSLEDESDRAKFTREALALLSKFVL